MLNAGVYHLDSCEYGGTDNACDCLREAAEILSQYFVKMGFDDSGNVPPELVAAERRIAVRLARLRRSAEQEVSKTVVNWAEAPFIDYLNAVDALLEERYGITTNDMGVETLASSQEDGWTPEETVEWLENKYDLDRIDTGPCGGPLCRNASSTT